MTTGLPSCADLIRQAELEATDPEHIALRKRLFTARDAANKAEIETRKCENDQMIRVMWGLPPESALTRE